jgi:hypothetical protein
MVRNQLLMDDRMSQLMQQYDVAYWIDLHKTLDTPLPHEKHSHCPCL